MALLLAAFNPDGTFALPANARIGDASAPATVGRTIVMYRIGSGPVSDGVTAGTLATEQDSLTLPMVVMFGNTKATLTYGALHLVGPRLEQSRVTLSTLVTEFQPSTSAFHCLAAA